MRLSKTADYALRIMVALAVAGEVRLSLQTISKQERIPRKFLEHVVRSLKEAGLIQSAPGPKGGYTLLSPPSTVSIAQILLAVQGPFLPADRLDPNKVPKHLKTPVEKLHLVINDIRQFIRQRLGAIMLTDLVELHEVGNPHDALMYYI